MSDETRAFPTKRDATAYRMALWYAYTVLDEGRPVPEGVEARLARYARSYRWPPGWHSLCLTEWNASKAAHDLFLPSIVYPDWIEEVERAERAEIEEAEAQALGTGL